MNGAMIDVHGEGEFNVPYDTNTRVLGLVTVPFTKAHVSDLHQGQSNSEHLIS